jgi:D-alanine-D-alanine ligase
MDRKKVLLLFGGESSEHDVSIASATNVNEAINHDAYEILPVYIDCTGQWWLLENFDQYKNMEHAQELLPALGTKAFTTRNGDHITPDVILPILHGRNGEDGSVQGLAQLLRIPIVGCGVEASALAMDKVNTKILLEASGIPTTPYVVYRSSDGIPDFGQLTEQLGSPLFVKPARAGSSIGVSRVQTADELAAALAEAEKHDTVVLVEKAIIGRELEVAMLGTPPHHRSSDVGEIVPDEAFYSFTAKYAAQSQTKTLVDIELDPDMRQRIRSLSEQIYQVLGCSGLARVDFLLSQDGELFCNEVNTLPGFTNISMYPKMWQHQGLNYPELIDQLLRLALGDDVQ